MALYAIVRVDRRFYVPSGVRGSYMATAEAAEAVGGGNVFDWGLGRERLQDEVLRVYSEEELFDEAATLADTLRYSQTSLCLDSASGKWALKRLSTTSLHGGEGGEENRSSIAPSLMSGATSLMSGAPSMWSFA